MLSAIILAAGLSSRMGEENKLLLPFNDQTVIATIVNNILATGLEEVIVVTGHEAGLVEQALNNLPVKFIHNKRYAEGMTSSIQQGISAANGNGYLICLSDMVTITTKEYKFIIDAFDERIKTDTQCICLPQYKNKKGNPVAFSAFYKDAILQNQEAEGCRNILQLNRAHVFMIDMQTSHVLQDFDYPEDYHQLGKQ